MLGVVLRSDAVHWWSGDRWRDAELCGSEVMYWLAMAKLCVAMRGQSLVLQCAGRVMPGEVRLSVGFVSSRLAMAPRCRAVLGYSKVG